MSLENQILNFNDFSIVFLSETCFAVTNDVEKLLQFEKSVVINPNYRIRKSKSAVGVTNFNVKIRGGIAYVYIKDRRVLLKELLATSVLFEDINLTLSPKYISYKKGKNVFVAIPKNDFTYLNQSNVIKKSDLGNVLYYRDIDKEKFLEQHKALKKLGIPVSKYIFDNQLFEKNESNVVVKNDLSLDNAFYFLDDNTIKLTNTGAKPILTYGFSKNNNLNYFDLNIASSFLDLKQYSNSNLNYNKNYFTKVLKKTIDKEFVIRLIQFNIFLPISFFDINDLRLIPLSQDDETFKIAAKFLQIRHRLISFLYSAYKEMRLSGIDVYSASNNMIILHKQLLIAPIFNPIDTQTKHKFLNIEFDDIYYDLVTGEKFSSNTYQFYALESMPMFAKAGSIIPLEVLNSLDEEYEIKIYPGADNVYKLHYNEHIKQGIVKHECSRFSLTFTQTKLTLSITPDADASTLPKVLHLNFINIRSNSEVVVIGSEYKSDYNLEKKCLLIDILNPSKPVSVIISNVFGLEIDRSTEFYNNKLETLFKNMKCSDKEYQIYKYKIKPYLHEPLDLLKQRIDKHIKFLDKKHKQNIVQMLELYKK